MQSLPLDLKKAAEKMEIMEEERRELLYVEEEKEELELPLSNASWASSWGILNY